MFSVFLRRLSEEVEKTEDEEIAEERAVLVAILTSIVLVLFLCLFCTTRCVISKFRPENTAGPHWAPKADGSEAGRAQYVQGSNYLRDFLVTKDETVPNDRDGNPFLPSRAPHVVPVGPLR